MPEILSLIAGIVKFLPEVRKLILLLQKAPAEKKEEITETVCKEAEQLKAAGRPKWDE